MSYDNLPDELKQKLIDELDSSSSGGDERLLILEDQNSFVEKFVRQNKINIRFDGSVDWKENPGIGRDVFITKIQQSYRLYAAKHKIASPNRLNRADLTNQFKEMLYDNKAEKLHRLENMIRYRPSVGRGEMDRFIDALFTGSTDNEKHFASKVFECFIWQVKRKVMGIPVQHHIMPVLYSQNHGTGKSVSVEALVAPLKEFVMHLQLDAFRDSFIRKAFSEHFIVIFDELQGAGRTDIESMKNVITATTLSARGMRTQDIDTIPQNCTFVGTTNRPLADLIFDNTGMRRFVQLDLKGKARLDLITGELWEKGKSRKIKDGIDFMKVWQSVEETQLNPILSVIDELEAHQETLRTKTVVEQWIEEFELAPGDVANNLQTVFNHHKDWLELQKKPPGMISKFSKDIKLAGLGEAERKMVNGKRARWVYLNQDIGGLKT